MSEQISEVVETIDVSDSGNTESVETPIEQSAEVVEPAKQPIIRTDKIEIDGKQYQVSEEMLLKFYGIDTQGQPLTDREWKTMLAAYKTHTHSNLENRKAINIQKASEQAFKMITENPKQALTQLFNNDPAKLKEFAEDYLLDIIKDEMLPEEQKIINKQQKELENYKRMIDQQQKQKEQEEMISLQQNFQKDISEKIISSLESTKALPKTPETIQRIAHYMLKGLERGITQIEPKDVIPLVLEDYQNQIKSLLGGASPEELEKFLGSDKVKALRQFDLKKVKSLDNGTAKGSSQPIAIQKTNGNNMSSADYNKYVKERLARIK